MFGIRHATWTRVAPFAVFMVFLCPLQALPPNDRRWPIIQIWLRAG